MSLDWIFEGVANWIASIVSQLMDAVSGIFLSALGTDMNTMESYFPFIKEAFPILQYTAWSILFLITAWQLFRAFGGPITEAENPWHLVIRSAICAFLIGYSKPIFFLALDIARAPYSALMDATIDPGAFTFAGIEQVLTSGITTIVGIVSVVGLLLMLILLIALGWNYFKLLLEAVERYIVVGVLCYTSPLAYSMGASKATNSVLKSWCRMVGSQLLLLILNVWFLRAFNSSVGQFIANAGALSNGHGNIFLWMFCALAFLKCAQRFDSHLAAIGLSVAQTGSSMGMEILMAARMVSGAASSVRSAGSVFGGSGGHTAAGQGAGAGFASKFRPNSYVRDAVIEGGSPIGANGAVGVVGRVFGGVAARNGATLSAESISSVAGRPEKVSGRIAGDIADRSLGNYIPGMQGQTLHDTQISGGRISTTVTGADGKEANVELFSAAQYNQPDMPHSTVVASDGSSWYQTATGEGAAAIFTPPQLAGMSAGETLSSEQASAIFPSMPSDTVLRTVGDGTEGVLEASSDQGTSLWYNSALYREPDAPHETVQTSDGVAWYALQTPGQAPQFEEGDLAEAYNQAQFQAFLPGYERQIAFVDSANRADGRFDVRHEDGTAMRFYDYTKYEAPKGDYAVYEDCRGGQWYAIPGTPATERRPVYENGKPVYNGETLRTETIETVRYRTVLNRFQSPGKRNTNEKKTPRKR